MTIDHAAHPRRLAGDVDIVDAACGTTRQQCFAVARKRSRSRQHDPCSRHQCIDCDGVVGVRNDRTGLRMQHGTHLSELVCIASGNRPTQLRVGVIIQILGGLAPGKPGGAEYDDVVRRRIGHEAPPRATAA